MNPETMSLVQIRKEMNHLAECFAHYATVRKPSPRTLAQIVQIRDEMAALEAEMARR